jgi:hypothetical protein
MKHNHALISAIIATTIAMGFASCSTEERLAAGQGLTINAGFNDTDSRVDYTYGALSSTTNGLVVTWAATDKIDVYSGSVSAATKSNPVYTLASGAGQHSATFTSGILQGTPTKGTTPLYAYVEKSNQTIDETASTVTVNFSNQLGTIADASSRDVLFATSTFNDNINFAFAHKMAIIKLNLNMPAAGSTTITLQNPSSGTLYSSVTLDATTGAFKSGTTASSITSSSISMVQGDNTIYLCVYPQALNGLFAIVSQGSTRYTIKVLTSAKTLEAGKVYSASQTIYSPILYVTSTKTKAIPLVVVGADYSDSEMSSFITKAKADIDFLFTVEPYKTYKEYFKVYILPCHSKDIGYVNTTGTNTDYSYTLSGSTILTYIANNIPDYYNGSFSYNNMNVGILANTDKYFGETRTYLSSGYAFAICSTKDGTFYWAGNNGSTSTNSGTYKNIFLHEFGGHAFGRLLDEYWYDNNKTYTTSDTSIENDHNGTYPFGKNIVTVGEAATSYFWDHMIPSIGTGTTFTKEGRSYEGGGLYGKGTYRPEQISVMDDNRLYFNAYSRELIVTRILSLAGETFDYETFCTKDVNNDPTSNGVIALKKTNVTLSKPLSPPVVSNEVLTVGEINK